MCQETFGVINESKMHRKNEQFDVISLEQNHLESLVVFQINNVSSIVRKTNIGQMIESSPFDLNYSMSIGNSKWVVILFLNGQYESGGAPNEHICVYLKMINCEQQSTVFEIDVKFQLGSEYAVVEMNNQNFRYDNARSRWIGTRLIKINEMIINGCRFIQNDTLLLSVHFNEHIPKHLLSTNFLSAPNENQCVKKSDSCNKDWTEKMSVENIAAIYDSPRALRLTNQSYGEASHDCTRNNNSQSVRIIVLV